jgi:hypothetical protein
LFITPHHDPVHSAKQACSDHKLRKPNKINSSATRIEEKFVEAPELAVGLVSPSTLSEVSPNQEYEFISTPMIEPGPQFQIVTWGVLASDPMELEAEVELNQQSIDLKTRDPAAKNHTFSQAAK